MKILTLTTLYPNAATPNHGVFVENRIRAFVEKSGADVRVVAPVPFFPFKSKRFGGYARFAAAPRTETRHGLEVCHPRYLIPPKIGMTYAAHALARCFLKSARELLTAGWDFDLIDAHYLYPDGVAAAAVARALNKPLILTARGTDVSLIPSFDKQRAMILNAVNQAESVICVASALRDALIDIGAPSEKLRVLRNGVDLDTFKPFDKREARTEFSIPPDVPLVVSVGHLIDRKGHDIVIEALASLPDARLAIAGDGERRASLVARAERLGVKDRVRFLGAIPHENLARLYSAADVLALGSSREGWPNVLLEAMACGAPAVAAPIWGCGEVIADPAAGALASERTPAAFAQTLAAVLSNPPPRSQTRAYAEQFSWDETAERLDTLFKSIVDEDARRKKIVYAPRASEARNERPKLLVTVDTEEAFDWDDFHPDNKDVFDTGGIERFQSLCGESGVRPLYFLTFPILTDAANAAFFKALCAKGAADAGLHMHQWVTPPINGFRGAHYSFQMNLPPQVHKEKLLTLAAKFEEQIGVRARAHRAGRYGVGPHNYRDLAAAGVTFDFSPSPAFDQSAAGGPDFAKMSNQPFIAQTDEGEVWVTPVSGARAIILTPKFLRQSKAAPGLNFPPNKERKALAPMRLTCEGASFRDLKGLTSRLLAEKTPVLTFSLHSTSLTLGGNQYAPSETAITDSLALTKRYFDYFQNQLGGEFVSLDDLAALYGADGSE
ncbi:MAG: glycosyltransferase [Pseudomonadota bacterium]